MKVTRLKQSGFPHIDMNIHVQRLGRHFSGHRGKHGSITSRNNNISALLVVAAGTGVRQQENLDIELLIYEATVCTHTDIVVSECQSRHFGLAAAPITLSRNDLMPIDVFLSSSDRQMDRCRDFGI